MKKRFGIWLCATGLAASGCGGSAWISVEESPHVVSVEAEADFIVYTGANENCLIVNDANDETDDEPSAGSPQEFYVMGTILSESQQFTLTDCIGAEYSFDYQTVTDKTYEVELVTKGECLAEANRDMSNLISDSVEADVEYWDTPEYESIQDRREECEKERQAQIRAERIENGFDEAQGSIRIDRDCADLGGYSNIPYMQIVIRDGNGEIMKIMEPNPFNGTAASGIPGLFCSNLYTVEDLPGSEIYEIDAGTRGTFYVSIDEIEVDEDGVADLFSLSIG